MQITANLRTFRTPWAIVVSYVRGGLDRDAFVGKKLTETDRPIDAAAIVVTGAPGRSGAPKLTLYLAAAAPEATALPVRLAGNAAKSPVDFLETVDRYANADPCTRVRMTVTEARPPHPKRLADLEHELVLLRDHTEAKRKGAPPDCVLAPSWSLAQAEQRELVRRRDARAALEYTLATLLRELGQNPRYSMATLLARATEENAAGEVSEATRGQLAELLRPGSSGKNRPGAPELEAGRDRPGTAAERPRTGAAPAPPEHPAAPPGRRLGEDGLGHRAGQGPGRLRLPGPLSQQERAERHAAGVDPAHRPRRRLAPAPAPRAHRLARLHRRRRPRHPHPDGERR